MKLRRLVAVVAAGAFALAACGGDDSTSGGNSNTGGGNTTAPAPATQATTKQPVAGGTLTFGSYSKVQGLDPIVGLGQGTSGGIPMNAVYDTLTRFDPGTKQYTMRTAESVTGNADSTEWTIKLKPNVKFSDGTDYDAEAVAWGINRHRVGNSIPVQANDTSVCAQYYACPRSTVSSGAYTSIIKDIKVVDKATLTVTLSAGYGAFPFILSAEAGMIPSPTAIKKACTDPTKPPAQCSFNTAPVGAGPFVVKNYKPDDVIEMVKNPNYYGGTVYLDGINFLDNGDTGGLKTWEQLKAGTVQAAFLRDPESIAFAKEAKFPGFGTVANNGAILLLNMGVNRADGTPTTPPTKDLKVRQAIQAAIDVNVVDQRGYGGKGLKGSELFQSSFPWDPKVPGAKFDLELAKKLVGEAKAAGWNGKLSVLYVNSTTGRNVGGAVVAMLQAAGIEATLETPESTVQQQRVITTKDFEAATWGMALNGDDGALWALGQNLRSTSPTNRVGFKSEALDKALTDLQLAKTDAAKTAAFKIIAEETAKQVPFVTLAAVEEYNAFSPKLQGAIGGGRSYIFFEKAWLEK